MRSRHRLLAATAIIATAVVSLSAQNDGFRVRSKVELVNVTATVSDDDGRFVAGLRKEDFTVYEDNEKQEISLFSAERVPVSLGILLDISGSMTPDKMASARAAIQRFTQELLQPDDELFLMSFAASAHLEQDWTTDRRAITRALSRLQANGGTAMYDALSQALPIATSGRHEKKAILIISDGNDTNSRIDAYELRQAIRESGVMVYALGVDATTSDRDRDRRVSPPTRQPLPIPFPIPGGRPRGRFPQIINGRPWGQVSNERVNADALRRITDDTGGRTEIVKGFDNLDEATAHIADELSKQYYLGYSSTRPKDGKWHTIRVDVHNRNLTVRARRGYVAS